MMNNNLFENLVGEINVSVGSDKNKAVFRAEGEGSRQSLNTCYVRVPKGHTISSVKDGGSFDARSTVFDQD